MTVESEINAEILNFAKELHPWQREILRQLIKKGALTAEDKKEVFKRATYDHNVIAAPSKPEEITLAEDELPSKSSGPRAYLVCLRDLENVNALKTGTRLSFGKGLTGVFGENASGKSGYARVMKKACTARAAEPILPNVYAKSPSKNPAKAIFEIDESGKLKEENWQDGGPSPVLLRRFAVFDAKCGRAYVSESNKLTFLPWAFDILDKLAGLTKEIKDEFAAQARNLEPKRDALAGLIDDTNIGKLLASLSAETNPELIKSKAKWDKLDEDDLKLKEQQLYKLKATSPAALRQSLAAEKKRIESSHTHLKAIEDALSEEKVGDVQRNVSEYEKYEQAVKAAAAMAFGDAELKGIGGEAWRELVLAAARYSMQEAYPGGTFPATIDGVRCVLCLQPLSDSAKGRLKKFWDFLHDETSSKRDVAKQQLDAAVRSIVNLVSSMPQKTQAIEELLASSQPALWADAKIFLQSSGERAKTFEQAARQGNWESISAMPASVVSKCVEVIGAISTDISKVKDDAEAAKQIETLSSEVEELKAQKRLSTSLKAVLAHLDSLKASKKLSLAASAISTLSITNKTKDLQKRYVTDAFRASFQTEVESLGIRRAKPGIAEHSEKGKVLHEVVLGGATTMANPAEVLSEGERTAVSVAYFLADLGSAEETCGIILDDPLTSLDQCVRENVINRLVSEAKKRQVIVFTHDLAVYSEIENAATICCVEFQGHQVEALGQHVGILSNDAPWDVLDVGKRIQKLEELANNAVAAEKGGDTNVFRDTFLAFYSKLRSTWERSVEELVFNKVVQRYDRVVKTLALDGVAVDTETVTAIFQGMTRTSEMIEAHDHAVGAHKPLPSSEEIRADLQTFKDFTQKQKAKKKAAIEKLSHLKK
jgi:ABC-type dipeptide/oligopeptide/nickel transport system ATPase subunit